MDNSSLSHLSKILDALRRVNRLIVHSDSITELCDGICSILTGTREYNDAWIILLEKGMPAQPYFHSGFGPSFQPMADLLDKGFFPVCADTALKTGSLSVMNNPVKECEFCPFFNDHDHSSGFSYPIIWNKKLLGWISVSVPKKYAEDRDEQDLFTEMADDLAFALYSMLSRESNESMSFYYETLINNAADSVLLVDESGEIIFINPAAEKLFFHEKYRNKSINIIDLFPEDRRISVKSSIDLVNTRGFVSFISSVNNKFSKETDVEVSMSKNMKAGKSRIICYIHDLTERHKAIKALRESEEHFQMLFDKAPLGYQSLDEKGCFLEVNQAWLDTLGYSRDEVAGRWFGDFLHPDYVSAFKERFPVFIKAGKIHSEFFMKKKNGDDCYIAFEGRVGHNLDGSFKQTHCILNDITEKMKSDMILREQEQYLRNIFENISAGVAIYEPVDNGKDFIVFDMNPAGNILTATDLKNIRGRKISEVFPGIKEFGLFKVLQNVHKTGIPRYLPVSEYSDENIVLYVENRVSRLPDGKIIVIFEDYSEQRKMEEEIHQIRKMESIGKLAGGIAHDLNNLLTPVLGYSEILKRNKTLGDREKMQVEKIYGAGIRASSLVSKLLTFSRKQPVKYKSLNLNDIINDFINILGKTIHEDITVKLDLDNKISSIKGDQGQIEQIIMNLCINSQDAMPDGGQIVIKTFSSGRETVLSVKDTGSGIPESVLPHIFEPFYSTKGNSGTGLGLSTVYGIVMQQGSRIDVKSKPGRGSEFIISFPECPEEAGEKSFELSSRKYIKAKRILLVEDDREILEVLENTLLENDMEIEKVENGKKALEFLEKDSDFNLIISDVIMPELNGISLFEIVSSKFRRIKFLFISGYTSDFKINGKDLYLSDIFIQKPFSGKTLIDKINEIMS